MLYCGNTDPLDIMMASLGTFGLLLLLGALFSIAGIELNSPRTRYSAGKIAFHAITKAATSTEKSSTASHSRKSDPNSFASPHQVMDDDRRHSTASLKAPKIS